MELLEKIPPLRLDRSRQAVPQIFEALRELIVSVTLEPGTVLSRVELARHYGLSQTPIRDALLRLADEGLVDIFPQHTTMVSRIDIDAALQAHFLRRALELEIVRTVSEQPKDVRSALVSRLRVHLREQAGALRPLDYARLAAADLSFHREMYDAAGVRGLWDLVRQRSGHVDRLRHLNLPASGKAQAVVRDHEAIADRIERGDAEAAVQALRQHLSGTLSFVEEVRARHPQWTT